MSKTLNTPPRKFIDSHKEFLLKRSNNFFEINVYNTTISPHVSEVLGGVLEFKQNLDAADGIPSTLLATGKGVVDVGGGLIDVLQNNEILDYNFKKVIDTFHLPMPNNIRESTSQAYDITTFNMEERIMRGSIGMVQNAVSSVSNDLSTGISSVLGLAEKLAERGNITIDPNPLMTYGGSLPRHFTFDFILNPNNAGEAEYFNEVVRWLKYYSLAERTTNNIFDTLAIRTLSIRQFFSFTMMQKYINKHGNEDLKRLDNINFLINSDQKTSHNGGFYLSSSNLVIGGQDSLQLYWDGAPKTAILSLSFVERQPLWDNDWVNCILNYEKYKEL